jgi:phospholipid/cholesterol/gamma-HCH transport system permease protein
LNQSSEFYLKHVRSALAVHDIFSGIGKTVFFALFISVIACYNGLRASGGADGVGRATTQTVVAASIAVLISDFFLTKLFLIF